MFSIISKSTSFLLKLDLHCPISYVCQTPVLRGGRDEAKVLKLISFLERVGVVYYNIVKICLECWLVRYGTLLISKVLWRLMKMPLGAPLKLRCSTLFSLSLTIHERESVFFFSCCGWGTKAPGWLICSLKSFYTETGWWGFKEASIGKTIAISLLNVIYKIVLTVFS